MAHVGRDASEDRRALIERAQRRRDNRNAFGIAIAARLREDGQDATFDGRLGNLDLPGFRMRVRLLWPAMGQLGQFWRIRVDRIGRDVDFDLLVRMNDLFVAKDYFVVPPADVVMRLPQLLVDPVPDEITQFWFRSPAELMQRLKTLSDRAKLLLADQGKTASADQHEV